MVTHASPPPDRRWPPPAGGSARAPRPRRRRGGGADEGRGPQPHRSLGLPRHGLRQAQASHRRRRRGRGRDRRGRRGRDQPAPGRCGRDLCRDVLRPLRPLPARAGESLREHRRRRHHGIPSRRGGGAIRARPRPPDRAGSQGRRLGPGGDGPGHLRHRAAYALRQCQAAAGRDDPGPCRAPAASAPRPF